ncbi:MAG: hypothetical protein OXK76_05515 [Gammaproteobacteria bacterium]|nr:hypothetical protein [Gammaproteobacteria bacterium]
MSVLRAAADNVRAELAANPKLRLGVWTIVAILLGYWVSVPQAARVGQAAADYATMDARLARGRDLVARQDWQQRLDEARAAEKALNDRVWHADNPGLAQAQVRTAVEEMARRVRLEVRVDVGLSRSVPGVPGLWRIDVQVNSRSNVEAALGLVHELARHPRILVAERLTLTRRVRPGRIDEVVLEGMLSAYFRLGPRQAQAAGHGIAPSRAARRAAFRSGPVGDGFVPSRADRAAFQSGRPQASPLRTAHGNPERNRGGGTNA